MQSTFLAMVLEKQEEEFTAAPRKVDDKFRPKGDVTVDVEYSTINYKDGHAMTNRSPTTARPAEAGP